MKTSKWKNRVAEYQRSEFVHKLLGPADQLPTQGDNFELVGPSAREQSDAMLSPYEDLSQYEPAYLQAQQDERRAIARAAEIAYADVGHLRTFALGIVLGIILILLIR